MPAPSQYEIYYCKDHKKHIYYFREDNYITGKYHCWDCIKELNDRKEKDKDYGNV